VSIQQEPPGRKEDEARQGYKGEGAEEASDPEMVVEIAADEGAKDIAEVHDGK